MLWIIFLPINVIKYYLKIICFAKEDVDHFNFTLLLGW